MIAIVNYGMGNLASIQNMFKKVGVPCRQVSTAEEIDSSPALVIPGVGKFDHAMQQIARMGLHESLIHAARVRKIPVLGICLGMQLMTRGSEEGQLPGFGWIQADTRLIDGASHNLRVPHMGWNLAKIKKQSPYFDEAFSEHRFYFVHSYVVQCDDPADIVTTTDYAGEFVSSYAVNNIVGVQFHPEKSHKFGARFLERFAQIHGLAAWDD